MVHQARSKASIYLTRATKTSISSEVSKSNTKHEGSSRSSAPPPCCHHRKIWHRHLTAYANRQQCRHHELQPSAHTVNDGNHSIENEDLSCYSYYLPHEHTAEDDQDGEYDSVSASPFITSQLDTWFHQLHPSNYNQNDNELPTINSNSASWTNATYKNQLLLRKTAWHTFIPQCTCEYGYSDTWQPLITSQRMITILQEITTQVSNIVMGLDHNDTDSDNDSDNDHGLLELNSVNLNYYPKGGGVGWHADDEYLFDGLNREMRIVSLSLCSKPTPPSPSPSLSCAETNSEDDKEGSTSTTELNNNTNDANFGARKFQVKQKGTKYQSDVHDILLRHGDLMTMEGMFQKHYLHSVWPGDSKKQMGHELCQGERINLTWRTIVRHLDGSKECRGLVCPLSRSGNRGL